MKHRTVLIVDDDSVIRLQLEKELKRNFFNTILAANGSSALETLATENVDILLLDLKLPDMEGIEILRQTKKIKPECQVIIITGFGTRDNAIMSLKNGAIDYIEKPIKMEELYAALGRAQEKLADESDLSYMLMVIDDEETAVRLLTKFLIKEGFQVIGAGSGKEGLKSIENNKIDVVITDIQLGDMTGIEVLQNAKKLYNDIEGIVITGYKDRDLAIKSLRAGAIDYITKPINLDELLLSINSAIERISLHRNRLYRNRELKISSEIINKMNDELERIIAERTNELNQTQSQLFQTSKLATLGEMAAGLAHEMNQPLGGISLTTTHCRKMIERDQLSMEELESALEDIEYSVKRMSKIIQHIRTFARQDTLKFIQVDTSETIESALSLLGEQLRLHEIEVVKEYGNNLPKIIGEPYQLEQVWINLISNARDTLDEKGELISDGAIQIKDYNKKIKISILYNQESGQIDICFKDNGMGICEEARERLFEPFFTTKEVGKAMGLGLSISYGIIESHKGSIEVLNVNGEGDVEGATIKVSLPLEGNND